MTVERTAIYHLDIEDLDSRSLNLHFQYLHGYVPDRIRIFWDDVHLALPCHKLGIHTDQIREYLCVISCEPSEGELMIQLSNDLLLAEILWEMSVARLSELHQSALGMMS